LNFVKRIINEMRAIRIGIENLMLNVFPDLWLFNRCVRPAVARLFGLRCHKGTLLRKDIYFGNLRNIKLGRKASISRGVFLDAFQNITIGENVNIGFRVMFVTSTHDFGGPDCRCGRHYGESIVVEDGAWIGSGACIGCGVTIGAGSVVSAGSVVMRSVPPNVVVSGSPARVIKRLDEDNETTDEQPVLTTDYTKDFQTTNQ
jgi:maltose O-acetyltransferase